MFIFYWDGYDVDDKHTIMCLVIYQWCRIMSACRSAHNTVLSVRHVSFCTVVSLQSNIKTSLMNFAFLSTDEVKDF